MSDPEGTSSDQKEVFAFAGNLHPQGRDITEQEIQALISVFTAIGVKYYMINREHGSGEGEGGQYTHVHFLFFHAPHKKKNFVDNLAQKIHRDCFQKGDASARYWKTWRNGLNPGKNGSPTKGCVYLAKIPADLIAKSVGYCAKEMDRVVLKIGAVPPPLVLRHMSPDAIQQAIAVHDKTCPPSKMSGRTHPMLYNKNFVRRVEAYWRAHAYLTTARAVIVHMVNHGGYRFRDISDITDEQMLTLKHTIESKSPCGEKIADLLPWPKKKHD